MPECFIHGAALMYIKHNIFALLTFYIRITFGKGVVLLFVRTLKRALTGFVTGVAAGNVIVWIISITGGNIVSPSLTAYAGSVTGAIVLQALVMGIDGALAMSGTMLYEVDGLPLPLSTAVHYFIIAAGFLIMDRLLGWESTVKEILVVEFILLLIFFIIWLVMNLIYKREVRGLNEELQHMQQKEDAVYQAGSSSGEHLRA